MAADLWLFIPLAILSNTAFPLPFDHILVWFAGGHSAGQAVGFAGLGSVCAGVAGLVDVAVAGRVGRHLWSETGRASRWFYLAVFLAALLPIPFTTIRVLLLRIRPRPLLYAMTVSGGRLPRYLVTVRLWQALAIPAWVGAALVLASVAGMMWHTRAHRRGYCLTQLGRRSCVTTSTIEPTISP